MFFCNLSLTLKQKQDLINELAKARRRGNLTVVNRITAVLAIAESGISVENIAKIIRVSNESIRAWVKKYISRKSFLKKNFCVKYFQVSKD